MRGTEMLFRGLSKKSHLGERGDKRLAYSSLCRRLGGGTGKDKVKVPEKLFIAESMRLLSDAKMQWHHRRDGKELQDLELTAELQHYEAATCLIDFTRNPLIALWFACGGFSSSDSGDEEGVIVAFEAGDPSTCKTIDSGDIENSIKKLFLDEDNRLLSEKPYVWNPPQGQNTRITAQQSVFVFGRTAIEIDPDHVFYVGDKENILKELSTYGITKKSLFSGDFDGFARILNSVSSPEADYYRIAREKHANGKTSDMCWAVLYYDKALEKGEHTDIYYHRGTAKFSLGDLPGALADANEAVRRDPDNIINLWLRGIVKSTTEDWSGAIADYDRAIEINSEFASAYYNRGLAKDKLGDYKGAIADYDRAIEFNPQDADAYYNRGTAKGQSGDYKGAITDFEKTIEISPQNAAAYNNRGITKRKSGNLSGAIADYDRAIEINPQYAVAYYNRGNAKDELGDYKGAIADYDRAIELNPQYATAYNNRGLAKDKLGDYKGAIADYDRAIELNPQDAVAYNNRGNAKDELGDKEGAIADYDRAIELNPQYATAYHNRGLAKEESGDMKGAAADFRRAKKLENPPSPKKK